MGFLMNRRPSLTKKHLCRLKFCRDKEVAKQGAFVYCYLDVVDLSPYYVGISSRWQRPMEERDFKDTSDYQYQFSDQVLTGLSMDGNDLPITVRGYWDGILLNVQMAVTEGLEVHT